MVVKLVERVELVECRDGGTGWPFPELLLQQMKQLVASLRGYFHSSVRTVANPPRQTKPARNLAHVPTESYTLYATAHEDMQSHSHASGPARIIVPTV